MIDYSAIPDIKKLHPELTTIDEQAYAAHMLAREMAFREIFGESYPVDQIITPTDTNLIMNWSGGGVYQYPPQNKRSSWYYVSHGLSQPYEPTLSTTTDLEAYSAWGIELVISTSGQSNWVSDVLFNLVKYLLFSKNSQAIVPTQRIPCNGPLVLNCDTKLDHLLALTNPEYESQLQLPAGRCDLVHLVGVTSGEIAKSKKWGAGNGGSIILEAVLQKMGVGYITDINRPCLTTHPNFENIWAEVAQELEATWKKLGWSSNQGG